MKKEKQSQKNKKEIAKKLLIAASYIGVVWIFWKVPGYAADKLYYYKKKYKG